MIINTINLVEKPKDRRFKDITGSRFGRLVVIEYGGKPYLHENNRRLHWYLKCDCGNIVLLSYSEFKYGHTRSCGCYQKDNLGKGKITHNLSRSPEYRIFRGIINRCHNINHKSYKDYGGRGIECRFNSFEDFIGDVGFRIDNKYSIERIDNNGHYERGNIKWALKDEQSRNMRSNYWITIENTRKCLVDWGKIYNISFKTINTRIHRDKWCNYCAVTIKPRQGKCLHIQ